jgi:hypothetical protein
MPVDPQLKASEEAVRILTRMEEQLKKSGMGGRFSGKNDEELEKEKENLESEKKKFMKGAGGLSKLFKSMVEGARNVFSKTEKTVEELEAKALAKQIKMAKFNASIIGKTFRFSMTLWKEIHKNIEKIFNKVIGHVAEVLGPIADIFTFVWQTVSGIFGSLKAISWDLFFGGKDKYDKGQLAALKAIQKNTEKEAKAAKKDPSLATKAKVEDRVGWWSGLFKSKKKDETKKNKWWNSALKYMKGMDKKLGKKEGGKGVGGTIKDKISEWGMNIIGLLVVGAALALGGLIGKILLPFKLIWESLKVIPFIGKLLSGVGGKIFGPVIEWVGKIITWFEKIPFLGKFIGKFFKFFMVGMKWVAWPLQIIMSVIDFIKGFTETEGDLLDKIIGGLQKVVLEFLDLPIRALGWIVEKVAGFFGIEIEDAAGTIKGWIVKFFDFLNFYYRWLWDAISKPFDTIGKIINAIQEWYKEWIKGPVVKALKWLGLGSDDTPKEPTGDSIPETPADEVQRKKKESLDKSEERETQRSKDMKAAADAAQAAAEAAAKAAAATQVSASNTNINKGGGGGGDSKQTPDEIDSALGMHNLAMEFNF